MHSKRILRQLIENAIEEGRSRQSGQTRFVHYFYSAQVDERSDSIPLYENMLFVLALLRSRKREHIEEAKLLLERLLSYQTITPDKGAGNFPVYLHDYPVCYSRWSGVRLLAPLYWIAKGFVHILGGELAQRLKEALEKLANYCLLTLHENPPRYLAALRIATGAYAAGRLFENEKIHQQGMRLLDDLSRFGHQPSWYTREGIAQVMISLQMAYGNLSDSPWSAFWEHVETMWHPNLQTYRGPIFDEWQSDRMLEPCLYDLLMACHQEHPLEKSHSGIFRLEGALIHPVEERLSSQAHVTREGMLGGTEWAFHSLPRASYSMVHQNKKLEPTAQKSFHPYYLQWRNEKKTYSLACSAVRASEVTYQVRDEAVDLYFTLPDAVDSDHPVENRELIFYVTAHDDIRPTVEGAPATTFRLGEKVAVSSELDLSFSLQDGEGEFMGHLMPGNRPSQRQLTKKPPTFAHDWQIFLRTVRKQGPCTVRATITTRFV